MDEIKTVRQIQWFDKKGDKFIDEYIVDIDLDILKTIFTPKKDDPLMYDPYWIRKKHAKALKEVIEFNFDFDKYDYFIDCYGIYPPGYDWSK